MDRLARQVGATRDKVEATTAGAKGLMIKGAIGHYLAAALIMGAVLLTLGGLALALAQVLDPALAVGGLGLMILGVLGLGLAFALKKSAPAKRS